MSGLTECFSHMPATLCLKACCCPCCVGAENEKMLNPNARDPEWAHCIMCLILPLYPMMICASHISMRKKYKLVSDFRAWLSCSC